MISTGLMAVCLTASPGLGQGSEGYQFLKAVRDRDGTVVTNTLNQPGTILVNAKDITTGETALHIVAQRRDLSWIRFLTERGANPNIEDNNGVTPLQIAANLGLVEGVEVLIDAGAEIDAANAAGETPLISAVHRRDLAMVRLLLKNGANPDRTDNSGRTARDYARLMNGGDQILEEMERADKAKGEQRTYGPKL